MTIPVYLFTGFLESGKSTLIKDTLQDPGFGMDEKTLLLVCEEGEVEYDDAFLKVTNTTLIYVSQEEDLTYEFLKNLDAVIEPDRVLIEFNGTWNLSTFMQVEYPFDWLLVQIVSTVDASSFEMYINNMRSMIYDQLLHSETIIFNRCDEDTKKLYLRNNIKAINKGAQLIYETKEGNIVELGEEDMPFDLHKDVIEIADDDYGLWYMDALEHPRKYEGKSVRVKAKVISTKVEGMRNVFVFGRYAMVCCADDTSLIGLLCHYKNANKMKKDQWVEVEAQIEVEYDESYHGEVPILYVKAMEVVEALKEEFVYFT
ncbi:TIGR03943 family putative permease subunit [Amedibacillus sp. YH-ame6]